MILAPIVGIVLNLGNAACISNHTVKYDMATTIVGVDTSDAIIANFQYLVNYNWVSVSLYLVSSGCINTLQGLTSFDDI